MMNMRRILLIIILLLALGLRMNQLAHIPVGMTDDELREGYSAYSVWKTGRGLTSDTVLPYMFMDNFAFNPVPIYLSAPIVGLWGISTFTIRFPYMLAGFFAVVGTYALVRRLLKQENTALISMFVMTVNVWAIQLSRMAYEGVFAITFYIWGTYVFISDWKKHALWRLTVAMTFLFLAFNSYDATKLLFVPLLILLVFHTRGEFRRQKKLWFVLAAGVVITLGLFTYYYGFVHPNVRGSRFSIFQNVADAAQSVELARRVSSAPEFLKVVYHNKLTYFMDLFLRHYLFAFSWDYLFLNQEASGIYSLWSRGNLYLVEIPFLLLGALALFAKNRKAFFFSLGGIAIAALPAGIGPEPFTYATRAGFMLPWLAMWVGAGISYAVGEARGKIWKTIVVFLVVCGYIYCVGGYLAQYYFEWPRTGAKYYSKDIDDLAAYLAPLQAHYPTMMTVGLNDAFFFRWALVNHIDVVALRQRYADGSRYVFGPIRLLQSCLKADDPRTVLDNNSLYVANPGCHKQKPDDVILLPDGEQQWAIYFGSQ